MCPAAEMERHTKLFDLYQWMIENRGDPHMARTIIFSLINGVQTKFVDMVPPTALHIIRQAATEQDVIGWNNILVGRLAKSWVVAQQHYNVRTASDPKDTHGLSWVARLISKIYDTVHDIWMF